MIKLKRYELQKLFSSQTKRISKPVDIQPLTINFVGVKK